MNSLIGIKEVLQITGNSKSMIYTRIKDNSFPSPVVTGKFLKWNEQDVREWTARRDEERARNALPTHKKCIVCGTIYKRNRPANADWIKSKFCSVKCRNNKPHIDPHEQFWSKVDKRGPDECWNFTSLNGMGYGQVNIRALKKTPSAAHRVSYEMHYGPIPNGQVVRHKCDNPACVNPDHLELGTQKDNARDAVERGRFNPKSLLNLRPGGYRGKGKHA